MNEESRLRPGGPSGVAEPAPGSRKAAARRTGAGAPEPPGAAWLPDVVTTLLAIVPRARRRRGPGRAERRGRRRSRSATSSATPPTSSRYAGEAIWESYSSLVTGSVGSLGALGATLVRATPLITAGLGVALAFRAGLFNIGAQGQIIMAGILASWVGFGLRPAAGPPPAAGPVAGIVGGAIWGGIVGCSKPRPAPMRSL